MRAETVDMPAQASKRVPTSAHDHLTGPSQDDSVDSSSPTRRASQQASQHASGRASPSGGRPNGGSVAADATEGAEVELRSSQGHAYGAEAAPPMSILATGDGGPPVLQRQRSNTPIELTEAASSPSSALPYGMPGTSTGRPTSQQVAVRMPAALACALGCDARHACPNGCSPGVGGSESRGGTSRPLWWWAEPDRRDDTARSCRCSMPSARPPTAAARRWQARRRGRACTQRPPSAVARMQSTPRPSRPRHGRHQLHRRRRQAARYATRQPEPAPFHFPLSIFPFHFSPPSNPNLLSMAPQDGCCNLRS